MQNLGFLRKSRITFFLLTSQARALASPGLRLACSQTAHTSVPIREPPWCRHVERRPPHILIDQPLEIAG